MKTKIFLAAILSSMFLSCSSDDSTGGDNTPSNFEIPLADGKFWTYDVKVLDQEGQSRDSLYIAGDSLIGGVTYKRFEVRDNIATGFYSSSLRNNGVRESDNKLLLTGDLSLAPSEQLPIELDLTLTDFIIFQKNATNGQVLSTKTGVIQQDFNGFPLTINYTLKSVGGESLPNFTSPNGDNYTTVISSKVILTASITTTISGIPVPITVLNSQDVLVSTQYVADGIGVVHTNTVTSYTISEAMADEIGIPASGSQTQQEFLDTHN